MSGFNKNDFTYGYEIEWGDIDRRIEIPEELGSWDYSETDVINIHEPYKYVACDPQGIEPPFGGEINTKPTKTIHEQIAIIDQIKRLFESYGNKPSASCVSHGHVHIHVPGLKDDIEALKKLTKYVQDNQEEAVRKAGRFFEDPLMKKYKAKMYLKYDGGRLMPDYMVENILNRATDFDSFIKMHAAGKDGVSMGRPFRYAINMYNMKHIGTIEFRLFRSSTDLNEIKSCFDFAEQFLDAALNDGPSVREILANNKFSFPPMIWDPLAYKGYLDTKYDQSRGTKVRTFYEVS